MRLYLLPVSTRRTLLYCQRAPSTTEQRTLMDKIQDKAARTWAGWEKREGGWQRKVAEYGNYAFRRIPFEEWGLKSVPPLSAPARRLIEDEVDGKPKAEVVYPRALIRPDRVPDVLHTLSTERESLHRKRLIWCFVGMPFTAPIALIPIVPNLPFFYLVYRAWSHWRALSGGRHIQLLLQKKLLSFTPSPILDQVYTDQKHPLPATALPTTEEPPNLGGKIDHPNPDAELYPEGEAMLLSQENGRRMTEALDLPQLEVELERAIWQVETAIRSQNGERDAATVVKSTASSTSTSSSSRSAAPSTENTGENPESRKER